MRSIGWLNALTDDIHMSRTLNGLAGWMNVFEQFDVLHDTILTLCMSLWPALPRSDPYATMFCTVAVMCRWEKRKNVTNMMSTF